MGDSRPEVRLSSGMVEIDGGMGEGGGQIIRTSLSLSVLLGVPFIIENIRRHRPRPGLRAQHLTAVRALKEVSDARIQGDEIGSERLLFEPRKLAGGAFRFEIGTAGATPLVLQAILPPLLFARAPSHVVLSGGTHVPISPTFHFVQRVFLPFLQGMDVEAGASLRTYGFYPRGGGEIEAHVTPLGLGTLRPFTSPDKKAIWAIRGVSAVANLPLSIAERQRAAAMETLKDLPLSTDIEVLSITSPGTGTFVFLEAVGGPCRAGFSSIGVRGKRAETVGREAAFDLRQYHLRQGCIDPHLADQIVLYLALARGTSYFTTTEITAHLLTNLAVIERFLGSRSRIEGQGGLPGRISIEGVGYRSKE